MTTVLTALDGELVQMIHLKAAGDAEGRTAQDNAAVRSVFLFRPTRYNSGDQGT